MIKNSFLFGFILLLLVKTIYPQNNLSFERLSLQEGVAHNLSYTMMKDRKGFLWFGTMYGLARYEGNRYTIFKHNTNDPNSLSFDDIISLFEDSKGNIWVGTWDGGLNRYNPFKGEFTRFIYDQENPSGINDNIAWAVCEDKNGNIWIGTERGGLNKFDPESEKFTHFKFDESNPNSLRSNTVLSLLCDSQGNLWVGSKGGLSKFNSVNNTFENFIHTSDVNSISSGLVRTIFEDSENKLWIGTTSGLNEYDGNGRFKKYFSGANSNSLSANSILSVAEEISGKIWIGTTNGLNRYDKKNNQFTRFLHEPDNLSSISGNVIYNIIEDNSGILWVNSYGSGINKTVKAPKVNFYTFLNDPDNSSSLNSNNILALAEGRDGLVWAGTANGLSAINPLTYDVRRIDLEGNSEDKKIDALAADFNGDIWLGTYFGLKVYTPASGKFYEPDYMGLREAGLFSSRVTSILIDSFIVWIGTYNNGLFRLDRKNNSLSRFSYEGKYFNNTQADYILTLFKDKLNRIWIGSYGGLMMYNEKDNSFASYRNNLNDSSSLSSNYVFSIFEDSRKELWVGTSNGLNRFLFGSSEFEHFFEKDGLPNSVICAITEDLNGRLWISTNKGLCSFNYSRRKFISYDIHNGLASNFFNPSVCVSGKNTNILFGSNGGCTIIWPGDLSFSAYNPPVYVSSIKTSNVEGESSLITSFEKEVEINSSHSVITINFASLDYSNPAGNKYMYMLEGIDNSWVNAAGRDFVTYTNLEPGEYILKLRGSNSDGVFSNTTAELRIIIAPVFWQSWWFLVIAALAVILFLFFLMSFRTKEQIKRAVETRKAWDDEIEKSRSGAANEFFNDLIHGFQKILLMIEDSRKKLHNNSGEIDPLLKEASENSRLLYERTQDYLWAVNKGEDTFYHLIIRLKNFGDELFSKSDIKFTVKDADEYFRSIPLNMEWKKNIVFILKEAMRNAAKHSDSKNITLEANVNDMGKVEIFLFDDGKGFDVEKAYEGGGLKKMKELAEKINSKTDIDSRLGVGTKVLFKGTLPYNSLDGL